MDNIKYKTFEDVTEVYGKTNLCKICNIKQIITYAKLGVQPVWIDEGYGGKLIAYYFIPETKVAWKYWLENRPDTGQAKNAADRDGNRSAGGECIYEHNNLFIFIDIFCCSDGCRDGSGEKVPG